MANPFTAIPSAPGAFPLVGHAPGLMRDPLAFLDSLPAHGDLVRVRLGPLRAVVVCTAELTATVLRDDHVFDKGGPFWDRVREFAGDGLSSCPHHLHRRQRRLVQPAFHPSRLPAYAAVMAREAAATMQAWQDGAELDVLPRMLDLTSRIVAVTMFSDALPEAEFAQALDDTTVLMTGLYRRMMTPPLLDNIPTPGNRAYRRSTLRLRETLYRIVVDRRALRADHGDLLSALLAAQDPQTRGGSTDAELTDQLITFFIAGSETAASCLSWTLHLLATRPDLQEQVHAEAAHILSAKTAAGVDTTTGRVITESLRMWPPVWMFTRTTTMDTELGGHHIPADTAVIVSPQLIHHRADVYPHPEEFDPDRWLVEPTPRTPYLPFSAGPRKCVGNQYALTEIAIALATVVGRWRVEALPESGVRVAPAATLRPRGLRLRVVDRGTGASLPVQRRGSAAPVVEPKGP
ncbi:cytochrome P450 [Actinokineospora diospyrosa]|uniref:Pentalenene oxygenase n=1 Tax=Actinokineospora diospyrosa TaxID=103728 RepID=A0ABT1IBD8_9PSEU|nr:cytochrome P450 [Actinokineospora diospyrosa]MCP2269932.1 pentalenene oxygenase [Actinokineospora diospyrosa]